MGGMIVSSSGTRLVGGVVITQDASRQVLTHGEVAWDGATGAITYVGPSRDPGRGDASVIDCTGRIIMPGLVNAHTHSGMTTLRGWAEDRNLSDWLAAIWPFEGLLTADDMRWSLKLAMVEMMKTGTTTFADMFLWDAPLLAEVAAAGMRVLAAPAMFGAGPSTYSAASSATGADTLALTEELAHDYAGDSHIRIAFGPHAPYTCTPEFLSEVVQRARRHDIPVQIHLSESVAEVEQARAEHGKTPIELAASLGMFEVPVLIAHGNHPTDHDIELLARADAAVSHNPVSNMKLGAGIAPIRRYRDAGITLGLGTDSVASNNNLDLTEEIKVGILLQRGVSLSPDVVHSAELLDMATCEGARAVRFPEVGTLAAGKPADIISIDATSTRATPLHDPIAFVTYAMIGASDVRDVWIAGRQVVADGHVTTIDEDEVRDRVSATAARITHEIQQ